MSYDLLITDDAKEDIDYLKKAGDYPSLKKLALLLKELTVHPRTGTGQPEELKYDFANVWSRRIGKKHRLVYMIDEVQMTVTVLYSRGHYKDK
jgi:toxin YoeB